MKHEASDVLKEVLVWRNMNQNDLAYKLNLSIDTISGYVNNPSGIRPIDRFRIAKLLGFSIDRFNSLCNGEIGFLDVMRMGPKEAADAGKG